MSDLDIVSDTDSELGMDLGGGEEALSAMHRVDDEPVDAMEDGLPPPLRRWRIE